MSGRETTQDAFQRDEIAHLRCGWIAPEDLDNATPEDPENLQHRPGTQSFIANARFFHAIHPFWYFFKFNANQSHFDVVPFDVRDKSEKLFQAAKGASVLVWPTIDGDLGGGFSDPEQRQRAVATLRDTLQDQKRRSDHISQLLKVFDDQRIAGIDLDYEGLDDGDRSLFTSFVTDLANAVRARNKLISVTVKAVVNLPNLSNTSLYDYKSLLDPNSAGVDALHVMTYDLHTGAGHAGPACPLWFLKSVMDHAAEAAPQAPPGRPHLERFLFGMANYGTIFDTDPHIVTDPSDPCAPGNFGLPSSKKESQVTLTEAMSRCAAGTISDVDSHDPKCPFHSSLCGWSLQGDAGCQPNGKGASDPNWLILIYFESIGSLRQRVDCAVKRGFGVTYWYLGNELPKFFTDVFDITRQPTDCPP